jgi:hypothetical protein
MVMRLRFLLLSLFCLLPCVRPALSQALSKAYTPVAYCDLLKSPDEYDGGPGARDGQGPGRGRDGHR